MLEHYSSGSMSSGALLYHLLGGYPCQYNIIHGPDFYAVFIYLFLTVDRHRANIFYKLKDPIFKENTLIMLLPYGCVQLFKNKRFYLVPERYKINIHHSHHVYVHLLCHSAFVSLNNNFCLNIFLSHSDYQFVHRCHHGQL